MVHALLLAAALAAPAQPKQQAKAAPAVTHQQDSVKANVEQVDYIKRNIQILEKLDPNEYEWGNEWRHLREQNHHDGKVTPTFYCCDLCNYDVG